MPWFSFLFNNFFLSISFWEQELEELQVDESFPLDPLHDHLGKENLWSDQLQQNTLAEKNKKKKKQQDQLSASVPDRELSQLHLHQLCLQDPDSTINRQLPEESLSSTCLSDSSLDPAASLSDNLSFSKQKLSEQDLSNNSFDKFFPENLGNSFQSSSFSRIFPQISRSFKKATLPRQTFSSSALNSPAFQRRL